MSAARPEPPEPEVDPVEEVTLDVLDAIYPHISHTPWSRQRTLDVLAGLAGAVAIVLHANNQDPAVRAAFDSSLEGRLERFRERGSRLRGAASQGEIGL